MRFLLQRFRHGLLLLFGVSILSFALFELAPGNYLDEMLLNPRIAPETVDALRRQFGLDQPLAVRYARWLLSVLQGDLGISFAYNMPVSRILWGRVANTLLLAIPALLLAWIVAVPAGVWSASRPGSWTSRTAGVSVAVLVAVPDLLVGLAFLLLAVRTGLFPVAGSLWLAVVALALVSLPAVFRHTRSSVAQALDQPFAAHLRACGIPERRILFRHVLPAALNPLIGLLGLSLASVLSSSLIVEVVLSWPGLGPLLLEAILARDVHVVIAAVMLSTVLLVSGNFAADLLLYAADPRIRSEEP